MYGIFLGPYCFEGDNVEAAVQGRFYKVGLWQRAGRNTKGGIYFRAKKFVLWFTCIFVFWLLFKVTKGALLKVFKKAELRVIEPVRRQLYHS